ncbi:MAG: ATP-dependent RecD-like DNA helicase [Alphaproteobacteria bacterium]|uniref:ATP-dependent RecD-like DNA helicase n=1 Tax=Candidatus Nitrobium versatile TaxID=2884831 RepID=A0A953J7U3_9BACT|nr:ATP-dependent RecD-like DNA helicase [Candidatus Nitrobium versatile]
MQIEIQGQVERITYTNGENGYTIAKIRTKGHRDLVTIAGNLSSINTGEILKIRGEWFHHPKYGEQVKVLTYESVTPATAAGIEKYLGSGLIKGIGPVMAQRIVARFGTEALDIIESAPERLQEAEGIGPKRVEMIKKAWAEQKEIKEVMLFLQSHGVSSAYATRIFKHYGKAAIRTVQENPYRLAHDIFGIGFLTADRIAEKMGIPRDSLIRAEAGIIYALHRLSDEGHVYCPYELLIEECRKILAAEEEESKITVERELIVQAVAALALEKRVMIEDINGEEIKENNKAVFLTKFHVSETGVAQSLMKLRNADKALRPFAADKALAWVQGELGITLAENQAKAVQEALRHKVMVITGGPGTGKTTIIKSIVKIYGRLGQKILLAAPTGRASKRMTEATGLEAKTLHRLLEFSPQEGGFKRNEQNPLEVDLIVIDETSMVDTILMHHFLKAVPIRATVLLVGDVDQLPSVGAGNVLKDVIASGVIPTVTLNEIFRQSKESLIIVNAHRVNKGEMPHLRFEAGTSPDFYFFEVEEPEKILDKVIDLCAERIPRKFGYSPVRDIQVLTAMHRGIIGAGTLNAELQKTLNPSADELARGSRIFRKGDKVMQTVNNYDKDVFNGDIGIITKIDREMQEITVDYDGKTAGYDYNDLDELVLAYAISVHKSQGSEYPAVVMPVHTQHYMLLQRNLLYTGITRGKRLVVLVGTRKAVGIAIRNNRPQERYTLLKDRLKSISG